MDIVGKIEAATPPAVTIGHCAARRVVPHRSRRPPHGPRLLVGTRLAEGAAFARAAADLAFVAIVEPHDRIERGRTG